jgi:hypothetical protein
MVSDGIDRYYGSSDLQDLIWLRQSRMLSVLGSSFL